MINSFEMTLSAMEEATSAYVARLIDNAGTASQNRSLVDDPVTREAIELNVVAPLLSLLREASK